jgi:PilX N-terminal
MAKHQSRSQGFILIAALLLLFLLSGVAVGVMMLTNSEIRIGGNDKESNMAFYGAESGMEKLTSDLSALYQANQAPSAAAIQNLTNTPPNSSMVGPMTYAETITFPVDAAGNPLPPKSQVISSGPNAGLTALIIPMTLQVNALRPSNAAANITRNVEVALIPVFQFGVFSDSDLSYFPGPPFAFAGRVHTNGNFFPTPNSGPLIFGSKITVVGEIVRDFMANGYGTTSSYNGNVYVPNANGGCDLAIARVGAPLGGETNCLSYDKTSESWQSGIPPAGNANPTWISTSTVSFNGFIGNPRSTGVKKLILPFVQGGSSQIEIVRKPPAAEVATSTLGASRLYNKANIRVLLATKLKDLHPERSVAALDAEDVDLGAASVAGTLFGGDAVAYANPAVDAAWKAPTSVGAPATPFPLVDGYLRVEYKDGAGVWHGVTHEWLNLGFGRDVNPPVNIGADKYNPNAILRLQELADTNSDGIADRTNVAKGTSWYPINFYDAREGDVRDTIVTAPTTTTCAINGIMNAVEIDAGNLRQWLQGALPGSGASVEFTSQNGYLLYFSDRRGMQPSPTGNTVNPANTLTGEYGFEDVINNPISLTGLPDGILDNGEKVDGNTSPLPDTWGAALDGDGFEVLTASAGFPYTAINCLTQGRMNKVTGARHVLRLIDGSLGNLPLPPGSNGINGGGFTVASENPVYVLGDYNASVASGYADANHAAAAVLADAVTLLSNSWSDRVDMTNPTDRSKRVATTTYYRLAIAAGKNITFSNPTGVISKDWGTDGGLHNFLRYLEDWNTINLNYNGSLVSLYYSQYATGTFKCCNTVYNAPNRKYQFDTLFLNPSNLPPGTPEFQDVVNLSYRQDFTPY